MNIAGPILRAWGKYEGVHVPPHIAKSEREKIKAAFLSGVIFYQAILEALPSLPKDKQEQLIAELEKELGENKRKWMLGAIGEGEQ